MTRLPTSPLHAEALLYAQRRVRNDLEEHIDLSDLGLTGIKVSFLDKGDGSKFARHVMKQRALQHPTHMLEIIDYARQGWGLADEALRELIIEFHDRGDNLPTALKTYDMEIVAGGHRKLPAQRREKNFLRDIAIVMLVSDIAQQFKLKPTRSPASHRQPSACSILAEALGMSEGAVTKIWSRLKPILAPDQ